MKSSLTLVGNLVDDVAVRHTSAGTVASFRMAASNGYQDRRTGQWVDRTTFVTVSAWRQLGENVAASLRKGQPVLVVGRPRQHEYEDRNGVQRSVIDVDADLVGHDLARGTAEFTRTPRGSQTADLARALVAAADEWAAPGVDLRPDEPPHPSLGAASDRSPAPAA